MTYYYIDIDAYTRRIKCNIGRFYALETFGTNWERNEYFCVVELCNFVIRYGHFARKFCFHLRGLSKQFRNRLHEVVDMR
jgi:hypothetical protein